MSVASTVCSLFMLPLLSFLYITKTDLTKSAPRFPFSFPLLLAPSFLFFRLLSSFPLLLVFPSSSLTILLTPHCVFYGACAVDAVALDFVNIILTLLLIVLPCLAGIWIRHVNTVKQCGGKFMYKWVEKIASITGAIFLIGALAFGIYENPQLFSSKW